MLKKMLTWFLTVLCVIGLGVATTGCESSSSDFPDKAPSEGLEYELSNDGAQYTVTDIGTCTDADIVIPSTYEGKPVTCIGCNAFYSCDGLTSVIIPDSVTIIESWAFTLCGNLENVTIGSGVTEIGIFAFDGCFNLKSVKFKDTKTWYCTKSVVSFTQKTGGTRISVSKASKNATYLKSTHRLYYWYKL